MVEKESYKGHFEFIADTVRARENRFNPFYETIQMFGNEDGIDVMVFTGARAEVPSSTKHFDLKNSDEARKYFNESAKLGDKISSNDMSQALETSGFSSSRKSGTPATSSSRGAGSTSTSNI